MRISYANAMSTLAVFLVLGAGAYAASKIGTRDIKPRAVTAKKLARDAVTGRAIRDRAVTSDKLAATERVRLVGTAGNPAFGPGFANYGSGFDEVGFYKDPFGIVHLQGLATGPATGTVFTLPQGYRPSGIVYDNVATGQASSSGANYVGRMSVDTLGNVMVFDGSGDFLSLENTSFRAAGGAQASAAGESSPLCAADPLCR